MYKFTNGVVVFTEEDKENFLKAGYILEKKTEKVEEENHENNNIDGIIGRKHEQSIKTTSRFRK